MNGPVFEFEEGRLALALGLPDTLLQGARKKTRPKSDWLLVDNTVMYSAAGLRRVVELAIGDADLSPDQWQDLEKKARRPLPASALNTIVARTFPNPHLVELTLPDKTAIRVRVQSSKALRPGMPLKVSRLPDGSYELAQRLPRTKREGRRPA